MSKRLTVVTQKGGVLKTSITTNLAGIYAQKGKVLIIDTDSQGNAALSFGENPDKFDFNLYDVLLKGVHYKKAIYNIAENIDILPANDDMALFEIDALMRPQGDYFKIMSRHLKRIEDNYDYVLIDSPPNFGLLHGNVLCMSENIIIPFQPEPYSMRSLIKILQSIEDFKDTYELNLNILGILPVMVDSRTRLHRDILMETRFFCEENDLYFFENHIPKSIKFAETVAYLDKPATMVNHNKKVNKIVKIYNKIEGEIEL